MGILRDIAEKIKGFFVGTSSRFWDDVATVFIILLVSLSSFGLGRLSILYGQEAAPTPSANAQLVGATNEAIDSENTVQVGQYVASKGGNKYHFPWCAGAQAMKEENKIYFDTKEEAEKAGYTPAANCKGL